MKIDELWGTPEKYALRFALRALRDLTNLSMEEWLLILERRAGEERVGERAGSLLDSALSHLESEPPDGAGSERGSE